MTALGLVILMAVGVEHQDRMIPAQAPAMGMTALGEMQTAELALLAVTVTASALVMATGLAKDLAAAMGLVLVMVLVLVTGLATVMDLVMALATALEKATALVATATITAEAQAAGLELATVAAMALVAEMVAVWLNLRSKILLSFHHQNLIRQTSQGSRCEGISDLRRTMLKMKSGLMRGFIGEDNEQVEWC